MPCQSNANGLDLDNVPTELQGLTSLERQLLAPHIPFMKLVNLPRGKESSLHVHGPVVNVPAKFVKVCSLLPRIPKTAGLIRIKLKRQLRYKGHFMYQMVRPTVIRNALEWLKTNNKLYKNVVLNQDWETEWETEDNELWTAITTDPSEDEIVSATDHHIPDNATTNPPTELSHELDGTDY